MKTNNALLPGVTIKRRMRKGALRFGCTAPQLSMLKATRRRTGARARAREITNHLDCRVAGPLLSSRSFIMGCSSVALNGQLRSPVNLAEFAPGANGYGKTLTPRGSRSQTVFENLEQIGHTSVTDGDRVNSCLLSDTLAMSIKSSGFEPVPPVKIHITAELFISGWN